MDGEKEQLRIDKSRLDFIQSIHNVHVDELKGEIAALQTTAERAIAFAEEVKYRRLGDAYLQEMRDLQAANNTLQQRAVKAEAKAAQLDDQYAEFKALYSGDTFMLWKGIKNWDALIKRRGESLADHEGLSHVDLLKGPLQRLLDLNNRDWANAGMSFELSPEVAENRPQEDESATNGVEC